MARGGGPKQVGPSERWRSVSRREGRAKARSGARWIVVEIAENARDALARFACQCLQALAIAFHPLDRPDDRNRAEYVACRVEARAGQAFDAHEASVDVVGDARVPRGLEDRGHL